MRSVFNAVADVALARLAPGIWRREWDVLCVLDGCRVDVFRQRYPSAASVWSVASMSKTWLSRTFAGRDLGDVAYITGNPFAEDLGFGVFHQETVTVVDDVETVPPSALAQQAIAVVNGAEGIDRVIVHFMQPHVPFRSRPEWFDGYLGTEQFGYGRWSDVGDGIDRDEWMAAYVDNLSWVLEAGVAPVCEALPERATVAITADHGNAVGEWGVYGHPRRCVVPAVRRVPWYTTHGLGGEVSVSVSDGGGEVDVDRQLAALGYREVVG